MMAIDTFRGRVYVGQALTRDRAMMYAASSGGFSGEHIRVYAADYLANRVAHEANVTTLTDGRVRLEYTMEPERARIIDGLVADGWVERREKTVTVPVDRNRISMFFGEPEHEATLVSYHATERGVREWCTGSSVYLLVTRQERRA